MADRETDTEYAVKVLNPKIANEPGAVKDLRREVDQAQNLTHQNLLKVNYLATDAAVPYIVMEYVDGDDLETIRRQRGGKLSVEEFEPIANQVLAALDYLHEKGVVHLDVKPQNVMVTHKGEVKLTDYGIARKIDSQLALEAGAQTGGTSGTRSGKSRHIG